AEICSPAYRGAAPPRQAEGGGTRAVSLDQFGWGSATLTGSASGAFAPLATDWLSTNGAVLVPGNSVTFPSLSISNLGVSVFQFRATDQRGVFAFNTVSLSVQLPSACTGATGCVRAAGPPG